jgi:alpha-N-arabinofuranosidase
LFGSVPALDAVATHDPDSGDVTVFVTNRHLNEGADLQVHMGALGEELHVLEAWTISDDDPMAANAQDAPDRVTPRPTPSATLEEGILRADLPPISWSAIRLARGS